MGVRACWWMFSDVSVWRIGDDGWKLLEEDGKEVGCCAWHFVEA